MLFKRHNDGRSAVRLTGIKPETVLAIQIADEVYRETLGRGCIVTSVCEGSHMQGSLHYSGLAVDIRTTADGIAPEQAKALAAEIRARLTDEYDVVVEGDHLHVEYDAD